MKLPPALWPASQMGHLGQQPPALPLSVLSPPSPGLLASPGPWGPNAVDHCRRTLFLLQGQLAGTREGPGRCYTARTAITSEQGECVCSQQVQAMGRPAGA